MDPDEFTPSEFILFPRVRRLEHLWFSWSLRIRQWVWDHNPWAQRNWYRRLAEARGGPWPKFCPVCMAQFHCDGTVTPHEDDG